MCETTPTMYQSVQIYFPPKGGKTHSYVQYKEPGWYSGLEVEPRSG